MKLFRRKGLVVGLLIVAGMVLLGTTLAMADPTAGLPPQPQPLPIPAPPR